MPPTPGTVLLHYRLAERIGVGGMGEVWSAEDTTLGRDVAIKILPAEVADNEDRIARFEREARTLAALQHPNVASIYGAHHVGDVRFLAMELVPGEDLAERLARGALDIDEALAIGRSIARGLAAAHDRGIVHRDLKPANVKLAPDGTVKILDFGLARALAPPDDASSGPSRPTLSPTVTSDRTVPGVVLGTAAYMSPEQARGRPVDRRTDLWALGCLLYELLSGRRAFEGETVSDTLAAVLRAEPDLEALPAGVPPRVRRLVARCLAKDADARWRDAGDACLEIEDAAVGSGTAADAGGTRRAWPWIAGAALVGALAGAAALGLVGRGAGDSPPRVIEAQIPLVDEVNPFEVHVAPEGSAVAVLGREWRTGDVRLQLRPLDREEAILFAESLLYDNVKFSPDSSQIAFALEDAPGIGRPALVRMPADASAPPVPVTPWELTWAEPIVWLDDGHLAVSDRNVGRVVVVPTDAGESRREVDLAYDDGADATVLLHDVLPDGRLLATVYAWDGGYHQDVVLVDLRSGLVTPLLDRAFVPRYVAPDGLMFARGDRLHLVGFDPRTGRVSGDERVVRSGLRVHVEATVADYDLSRRGDLVFIDGGVVGDRRGLVRVEPDGVSTPLAETRAAFGAGSLDDSQDGSVIAVVRVGSSGLFSSWAMNVEEGVLRPVFDFPGMDCDDPTVSNDGSRIVAQCIGDDAGDRDGVWLAPFPPDGSDPVQVLRSGRREPDLDLATWLPDGRRVFVRRAVGDRMRAEVLDVEAGRDAGSVPVPSLESTDVGAIQVSPDGTLAAWIARSPNGVGELRIAPWHGGDVGPFRPAGAVSTAGLDWTLPPAPGRDGWTLVAVREDGGFETMLVGPDGRARERRPHELADAVADRSNGMAIMSDGSVVIIERDPREAEQNPVRIVTDWLSAIRGR